MKTAWLRSLIRRYGPLGVLLAGAFILLIELRQRKRLALAAGILLAGSAFGLVLLCGQREAGRISSSFPAHNQKGAEEGPTAAYSITEIGALGGGLAFPLGVNAKGQVVGWSLTEDDSLHPFLWQNGKTRDLGTLGGSAAVACAVNDRGQVVGLSQTEEESVHAFRWENGRMTDLSSRSEVWTGAYSVSSSGKIAGAGLRNDPAFRAVLWEGKSGKDLGTLPGFSDSFATGVNDKAQVVGALIRDDGEAFRPFLWQSGKMTELRGLQGGDAQATGLNDAGQIVGGALIGNGIRAVLWENGKPHDLGALPRLNQSFAYAVNDRGEVVGAAASEEERLDLLGIVSEVGDRRNLVGAAAGEDKPNLLNIFAPGRLLQEKAYSSGILRQEAGVRGVIWRRGKIADLNDLIPRDSGWTILIATAINSRGQITALAEGRRGFAALLLTPSGG